MVPVHLRSIRLIIERLRAVQGSTMERIMKSIAVVTVSLLLALSSSMVLSGAETRVIRVGAFNYYPGIFKNTDGRVKGFYVDALAEIAKQENIRFEYVYGSWSEGLERIKSGDVDLLTSVAVTSERAEFLDYATVPLLTVWGEVYTPLGSNNDGIREVQGKKIAVMKGDFNARYFIELVNKFDITCEFVELPGFEEVFRAVAAKTVDAGVVNSTFGVAKQKEFGLRSTGIVFNPFDIFFAVGKGKNQNLILLLDNYMSNWRHQADSPYNKARHKWSHSGNNMKHVVPRWVIVSVAALCLLVAVATAFIVLLRKKVRAATDDIRKSKLRLKESNAYLENLINYANAPIIVWDPHFRITRFNHAFEFLTGHSEAEVIGQSLDILFPSMLVADTMDLIRKASIGERWETVEIIIQHRDDSVRTVLWNSATLFTQDGQTPIATIAQGHDITIRKQYEKELLDKNAELERFTYTVSHDLKSPLITIQYFTGQIMQDHLAGRHDSARDDLEKITAAASKMTDLLNDLLELSRIGRMKNSSEQIDMGRLIEDILAQLAGPLEQRQIEIVVQPDLPVIHGDQKRIAEVMQNLVENAIKYMGEKAAPRIEVGAEQHDIENIFFVRDNGAGIDPLHHERIFGLFNKLDTKSEGTGVGLALVKRIIEVHGGRVWVESEGEGKGSQFCFTVGS